MSRIFAPLFMLGAFMLCVVLPVRGDEVPFAQPAPGTTLQKSVACGRVKRHNAIDAIAAYEALVCRQVQELAAGDL